MDAKLKDFINDFQELHRRVDRLLEAHQTLEREGFREGVGILRKVKEYHQKISEHPITAAYTNHLKMMEQKEQYRATNLRRVND